MKKLLYISIGLILGASALSAYAAVPPFQSSQVGSSPVNGYYLQTNGSVSSWAAVSSSGGTGFSTTSANYWLVSTSSPLQVGSITATSTTATSLFNGNVDVEGNIGNAAVTWEITGAGAGAFSNVFDSGLTGNRCVQSNTFAMLVSASGPCATFAYPFTTATNFGVTASATTTPIWAELGIFASSTSQFTYASTTAFSATASSTAAGINLTSGCYAVLGTCIGGGGGGGSQTPWTSNINGGGYSLSNVNTLTATNLDITGGSGWSTSNTTGLPSTPSCGSGNTYTVEYGSTPIFYDDCAGEMTFGGSAAFFGIADRAGGTHPGGGFYQNLGTTNFWDNVSGVNMIGASNINDHVVIGPTSYGTDDSTYSAELEVLGSIDTDGFGITTSGGDIDTGGGKLTTHGGGVDPAYLELDAGMNQRSILAKMKEDDAVRMPGSLWMYYDASTSELMALMPVSTTTVKQFEIPMTALPDITTDLTPSIKAGAGSAVYKSN